MKGPARTQGADGQLDPERVAYWYLRLNGFLQIENFVIHPSNYGSQRTDADLLAVRFPHRREFLLDRPEDPMGDDQATLALAEVTDVAIVEVKTNAPCTLNGPWTEPDRKNVQRVLLAIGCIPVSQTEEAAQALYADGTFCAEGSLRIRLIAIGRERNPVLEHNYPGVTQVIWSQILDFIWHRFRDFRRPKTQVDQWAEDGKRLKRLADNSRDATEFKRRALKQMSVHGGAASRTPMAD